MASMNDQKTPTVRDQSDAPVPAGSSTKGQSDAPTPNAGKDATQKEGL